LPMTPAGKDFEIIHGWSAYKDLDRHLIGSDIILTLLSISDIKGNTKMQKQTFLAWKEAMQDVTFDPVFFPFRFGAYSRVVEDTLRILEKQKYIKVRRRRGEGTIFSITELGREKIGRKLKRLGTNLEALIAMKRDWDEWTPQGTLRYVYRKYPEFTSETEVPFLKW
jgi:uncharacterized protein YwgA